MAGTGNSDPLMDALLSESTIADGVDMLVDALEPYVSAVNAEQSDYLMEAIQNSTEDILPTIPRKRNFIGRPSLAFIPGVVEEVKRILLQAGAAASEKRRTQEYGLNLKIGISTVDLRDHIFETIPEVREKFPRLSERTVRRLGIAPNKNFRAAVHYHAAVPFKIISSTNDAHPIDSNSHECFSQVRLIKEEIYWYQGLGDNVAALSVDNATSLRIGDCTLTSRFHQNNHLYLMGDSIHTPPHDFCKFTITPNGYLKLPPCSTEKTFIAADKRNHVVTSSGGSLELFLRADYFFQSTIAHHVEDLLKIYPNPPGFLSFYRIVGPIGGFSTILHLFTMVCYGLN
jgi:hypothetical protein